MENSNNKPKRKQWTQDTYIARAKEINGGKYDYSEVIFKTVNDKIKVICKNHDSPVEFYPLASGHIFKSETKAPHGCPKCSDESVGAKVSKTKLGDGQAEFLRRAAAAHGDKYLYEKAVYHRTDEPVIITCRIHGDFSSTPQNHTKTHRPTGCPLCGNEARARSKSKGQETFLKEARSKFGETYLYEKTEYIQSHSPVIVTCPKHGDFSVKPFHHLSGQGCQQCGVESGQSGFKMISARFFQRAAEVHGVTYDYSSTVFQDYSSPVSIICRTHGPFEQKAGLHINGHGCQRCGKILSKGQIELRDYIQSLTSDEVVMNHKLRNGSELDVYIPSRNVGFEYNGIIWHSERFNKDSNYHLAKTRACEDAGVRLIHVFEDDWISRQDVVKRWIEAKIFPLDCVSQDQWDAIDLPSPTAISFHKANSLKTVPENIVKIIGFIERATGLLRSAAYLIQDMGSSLRLEVVETSVLMAKSWHHAVTIALGDLDAHKVFIERDLAFEDGYQFPLSSYMELGETLPPAPMWTKNGVVRFTRQEMNQQLIDKGNDIPTSEDYTSLGYYRIWDCGVQRFHTT